MQPQVTNLHPSSKNHRIEYDKPTISKGELKTVLECLVEDQLYTGSIVERFEKEFRSTFQFKYSLSVNSLFAAYHLSLLALGVKAGDRVLLSSFAPLQALDALFLIGAEPVPLELGKSSFHPSPEDLQKKIKEKEPKAIILDHTFGCLLNFKNYDLANIPVIEDYSEALGADLEEIPVGKQGTLSICGLAENHVITTGNGAMISSNDANLHNFMKNLRFNPTAPRKDRSPRFEYNLIDYQAAMGIEQLSKLGLIIERKKKIAQVYLQAVMAASHETYFQKAAADQFNRFPVIISKKYEEIERYFNSLQIKTRKTISEPIHKILELETSEYPNAERLYQRGHCIPIYPNLTRDNVNRIANSIRGIY